MSVSGKISRPVYGTEMSWCKAVPGGTGITVLALLMSKQPDFTLLENTLRNLQISHPILRSKVHVDPTTSSFSFLISPSPTLHLRFLDIQSTAQILQRQPHPASTPFHTLLEHELNSNPWGNHDLPCSDVDVFRACVYALEGGEWVLAIGLHTGACDRTAAVALLKDLTVMMSGGGGEVKKGEVKLGIEEYIPSGKGSKPFWARGVDMLGYSLNSFRFSNLDFVDTSIPRSSQVVRLLLDSTHTRNLLEACKSKGIKLCGALSAAGLMAARLSKGLLDGEWEKYAVVTLTDCRKRLEPALSDSHIGFYHSALLNTHDLNGSEELWELATRTYTSFQDAMNSNKHFTDMADLNFLMCKAIENPGLTPSSSLRTSFISVFEESVIEEIKGNSDELGFKDCVGCASVHGVGPSIAIFDTIRRNGSLDCACVYPFPLHSREQMQELIDNMKRILIGCLDSRAT